MKIIRSSILAIFFTGLLSAPAIAAQHNSAKHGQPGVTKKVSHHANKAGKHRHTKHIKKGSNPCKNKKS
jgi:hypothetical protein